MSTGSLCQVCFAGDGTGGVGLGWVDRLLSKMLVCQEGPLGIIHSAFCPFAVRVVPPLRVHQAALLLHTRQLSSSLFSAKNREGRTFILSQRIARNREGKLVFLWGVVLFSSLERVVPGGGRGFLGGPASAYWWAGPGRPGRSLVLALRVHVVVFSVRDIGLILRYREETCGCGLLGCAQHAKRVVTPLF